MPAYEAFGGAALLAVTVAVALATLLAIPPLMPVLQRYALARPNARSSHRQPTPQGGGIAVIGAALMAIVLVLRYSTGMPPDETRSLGVLVGAALALAVLGALDDMRPLPALPRLVIQVVAVGAIVASVPRGARLAPEGVPLLVEQAVVTFAGVWFVNLVNFMDGLDWMTVAGLAPAAAGVAVLAAAGAAPVAAGLVAAALLGGLLGFAPFNRPVARLFLGDVGSLPLGLMLGYALYRLALAGHLLPALILPLYYLTDATLTLVRRGLRGAPVMQAHREHCYQRATEQGMGVTGVVARVGAAGLALALIAGLVAAAPAPGLAALGVFAAALVVAVLMADLARPRGFRR